ncbi:small subunit processome component 20 homolog [Lingula anatina]|uniref:Small subunit processome component 20 homolog n=1 Tax=Lingula anatina TaxID=7574 RepID=A0A2R2MJ02_LINAN|nr:small subunit processome component 20 homolog [Lingula anatina]|eukprot:XP_023930047.1 small subunit processome component 20 homolog [Lingula anatina]
MKTKSSYHRSENTFRFLTFSERVANINIDVIRRVDRRVTEDEEVETYFGEALQKWTELNCTEHFTNFRREISGQVNNFAQLVHHKQEIIDVLKRHLQVTNSLAFEPLLDLVVNLARDLQADFTPHFQAFFDIIVALLNAFPQNTELLEQAFTTLAYLFKILWRYLVKDIENVFRFFSPLLGQQHKEYINNFAAESFAFLMRKVKDHGALFNFMFKSLEENPDQVAGVGRLLFEMSKGVRKQFHSCTEKVFPIVLSKLGPQDGDAVNLDWDMVEQALISMMQAMTTYTSKEESQVILNILESVIFDMHKRWTERRQKKKKAEAANHLHRLLKLQLVWVQYKDGVLLSKPENIAKQLCTILIGEELPVDCAKTLLQVTSSLLLDSRCTLGVDHISKLIATVFKTSFPREVLFSFTRRVFSLPMFEKDMLPPLMQYCHECVKSGKEIEDVLQLLTELVIYKTTPITDATQLDTRTLLLLDFSFAVKGKTQDTFPRFVTSLLTKSFSLSDLYEVAQLWAALVCVPHVRPLQKEEAMKGLRMVFESLSKELGSSDCNSVSTCLPLLCQTIIAMLHICHERTFFDIVSVDVIRMLLRKYGSEVHMLRTADLFFTKAAGEDMEDICTERLGLEIFPYLQENLSSSISQSRLLTLRIMSCFDLPLPECEDENTVQTSIFSICLAAEMIPITVQDYREKLMHLRKLDFEVVEHNIPVGPFKEVNAFYLVFCVKNEYKHLVGLRVKMHLHMTFLLKKYVKVIFCFLVSRKYGSEVHMLRTADLFFTKAAGENMEDICTEQLGLEIFPYLQENLSSSISQSRLLTLRIMSCFDLLLPECEDENTVQTSIFSICLAAEMIPITVQDYREKLMHLRKLDFEVVEHNIPVGPFKEVPLRYLLGMMYVNFTLIWDPLLELIKTQACGLEKTSFWNIYIPHLKTSAELAERSLLDSSTTRPEGQLVDEEEEDIEQRPLEEIFRLHCSKCSSTKDRPDHANVRLLLWKAMHLFPDKCEAKTREIVPLFFRFLENEYYPADLHVAPTQDLRKPGDGLDEELEVDQGDSSQGDEEEGEESKGKMKRKRAPTKTLLAHLRLFTKFKSPKSVYQEPRLRELYQELLKHKDPSVQQVAMDCIYTYNYKYITPYKENFNRLLDNKTFKNEIILFSIDTENSVVDPEHREGLLPLLMRILYGKMLHKTGKDSAGKGHSQFRKAIVFRFLAGCQQQELKIFMDLIFQPFVNFATGDALSALRAAVASVDLSKMVPLRKQQGLLNTMDVIFNKLGNLIDSYLPTMYQILVCLAGICVHVLDRRVDIHPKAINTLKTLRQLTINRITQFFSSFDNYSFSWRDIDAVFEAVVWPQVERLPHESLSHPTPLLKLICAWSQSVRYLPLLGKHQSGSKQLTPLKYVFQLLVAPTASSTVTNMIVDIIEHLLTLEEKDEEEEEMEGMVKHRVTDLEVHDLVVAPQTEQIGEPAKYGCRLLLPHVPIILQYLKQIVENLVKQSLKKRAFPTRDLNILSRLSAFVKDSDQSATLIQLLLPFLERNITRTQDVEVDILQTVANLIRLVDDPKEFVPPLCKLFSSLHSRVSRTALCHVLKCISERDESISIMANIVHKLNAWDARRVEEPDYMTRLDAYKEINHIIQKMEPCVQFLRMVIYNCCFCIGNVDDLSLRDNASFTLQEMVKTLASKNYDNEVFVEVVLDTLIPEIKLGLKNKTEVVRHEMLNLFSLVVRHFQTQPKFLDFVALTNEDLEVDFFENIRHIQTHRRSRAMRRLIKHMTSTKLKNESLLSYMLPIATSFLTDKTYEKAQHLIEAAVDLVGAICRQLPWEHYLRILKYYLGQLPKSLENQKLMVRIVVTVLEAFHFDLSKSRGIAGAVVTEPSKDQELPLEQDAEEEKEDADLDEDLVQNQAEEVSPAVDSVESVLESQKSPCAPGLASRIHRMIVRSILPELHRCLTKKTKSDEEHKLAQPTKYAEDEEVLRVPIALAMVKLLQNLPKGTLEHSLPSLLIKVCEFLRSRSKDIRNITRDTLVKIVDSLGPSFFHYVLKELRGALTKGYQLHVLSFTVHSLLKSMTAILRPGDLDNCVQSLTEVFSKELFGQVAEEKEVEGIVGKLFEARSSKSYDSYEILAKFISKSSLTSLIIPLKEVLDSTHSHKISKKVQEVLRRVTLGLIENKELKEETLLIFIHGLANEALPLITPDQKDKSNMSKPPPDPRLHPPSTLLLTSAPPRGGVKPSGNQKTNMHILVDFGLQLLYMLLKRSRVVASNTQNLQMLDPFIEILSNCLYSKHVKVVTTSLRCLSWMLKFPLPSLKDHITKITNQLFVLLKNYATAGGAQGENFELVVSCFKTITVLVRDVKFHSVDTNQLQILLGYVEEDMHDFNRQATAFGLLKAILSRKLLVPEIHEIIGKVAQLSITADAPNVRLQSRQVVLQFMLDYPLGKQLKKHLEFYVTNLQFELESGRESALEMLATIFSSFPQNILTEHAGFFFVPMAASLVNDESAQCRKLTALAIKSLLSKLHSDQRDELLNIAMLWFQDEKVRMGIRNLRQI